MSNSRLRLIKLRTLSAVAKLLPHVRGDRPVHPSTLHRWRTIGCRGVRLKCVKTPAGWRTTLAEVHRFFDALTRIADPAHEPLTPARERRRQDQVERDLAAYGLKEAAVEVEIEKARPLESQGGCKASETVHHAVAGPQQQSSGPPPHREDEEDEGSGRIPPARRTRPLGKGEAALLMGYLGNSKYAAKQLHQAMKTGAVKFERQSRQRYIFDRNEFPAEVHAKLLPTRTNSP